MKLKRRSNSATSERLLSIIKAVTKTDPKEINPLNGKITRRHDVAEVRMIFYKIMKEHEHWSLARAANVFDYDHATAYNGINRINILMPQDEWLKASYEKCLKLHLNSEQKIGTAEERLLSDEILSREGTIEGLNTYIVELERKFSELKDKDKEFESVFSLIRNRMPIGKSEQAAKKIQAILNGL